MNGAAGSDLGDGALRRSTDADFDAIHAIELETFGTDAWSAATLADELAGPHRIYLVLEVTGVVRGYGGLLAVGTQGDIQTIAVDGSVRGAGYGRRLMEALIVEAEQRGVAELFLEVRADNPAARGLYESEGFVEIGRRARYYQPDDVDAVIMKCDLRRTA